MQFGVIAICWEGCERRFFLLACIVGHCLMKSWECRADQKRSSASQLKVGFKVRRYVLYESITTFWFQQGFKYNVTPKIIWFWPPKNAMRTCWWCNNHKKWQDLKPLRVRKSYTHTEVCIEKKNDSFQAATDLSTTT